MKSKHTYKSTARIAAWLSFTLALMGTLMVPLRTHPAVIWTIVVLISLLNGVALGELDD